MTTIHEIEEREFGFHGALWDATPGVCCAAFQLGACAHTEGDLPDGYDPDEEEPIEPTRTMVAFFPRMPEAIAFIERYNGIDTCYMGMTRKGRTVTWEVPEADFAPDADGFTYLFGDLLENVGYYGAPPQGKVATLNGHPAPRTY